MIRWLGVDVASQRDATAMVVVEPVVWIPEQPTPEQLAAAMQRMTLRELHFHVRCIAWLNPGTSYPSTIDKLVELDGTWTPAETYYDRSDLGVAVRDMLDAAHRHGRLLRRPDGITITSGRKSSRFSVTRPDLISLVTRPLAEGRLHVDPDLPGATKLAGQLRDFRVTAGAGAESESTHDDLVIALALALIPSRRYRFGGEPEGAEERIIPAKVPV